MEFWYITVCLMLCLLVFTNVAYAHETDLDSFDLEELVETYNDNLDQVPSFVKGIFGNERINIYVDGELFVGLTGNNGTITEYKKSGVDKPTMNVFTTGETITHLAEGDMSLLDAIKDKSVSYEGVGFVSKIKFAIIKIFQGFFLRG